MAVIKLDMGTGIAPYRFAATVTEVDDEHYDVTPKHGRTVRVHKGDVLELRRVNTMRLHCFYCWDDATHLDGVVVCEHHVGDPDAPALREDEMWAPGINDDPA